MAGVQYKDMHLLMRCLVMRLLHGALLRAVAGSCRRRGVGQVTFGEEYCFWREMIAGDLLIRVPVVRLERYCCPMSLAFLCHSPLMWD